MKRKIRDIEECGVSINNAFDNFITSKKSEGRRDATIRSYKGSIKDFMKFVFFNEVFVYLRNICISFVLTELHKILD